MKKLICILIVLFFLTPVGCAWFCSQDIARIHQLANTLQAGYATYADLAGKDPQKYQDYIVKVDQGLTLVGPYIQGVACPPKEIVTAAQAKVDAAQAVKLPAPGL